MYFSPSLISFFFFFSICAFLQHPLSLFFLTLLSPSLFSFRPNSGHRRVCQVCNRAAIVSESAATGTSNLLKSLGMFLHIFHSQRWMSLCYSLYSQIVLRRLSWSVCVFVQVLYCTVNSLFPDLQMPSSQVAETFVCVFVYTCDAPLTLVVTGLWYCHCSLILNPNTSGGGGQESERAKDEKECHKQWGREHHQVALTRSCTGSDTCPSLNPDLDPQWKRNSTTKVNRVRLKKAGFIIKWEKLNECYQVMILGSGIKCQTGGFPILFDKITSKKNILWYHLFLLSLCSPQGWNVTLDMLCSYGRQLRFVTAVS